MNGRPPSGRAALPRIGDPAVSDRESEKQLAARHAVRLVQDGMRVGLGSGTTAAYAIRFLGERIRDEGLRVVGIPTSAASRDLAESVGVPLATELDGFQLDIAIDGADQATRAGHLIKGGGGALLHERIVDAAASRFVVIGDSSKVVKALGGFPLPVEVFRFGWRNTVGPLTALGGTPTLRQRDGQPFVTEEGNLVIDCVFSSTALESAHRLSRDIRFIPGVADHGLFLDLAHTIIIARGDVVEEIVLRTQK